MTILFLGLLDHSHRVHIIVCLFVLAPATDGAGVLLAELDLANNARAHDAHKGQHVACRDRC